ncbi:hypothetical protein [Paraliobacillus salinarum]|uniref:hypothetical protein n=1 Tax=Paraliobacillus salinarum TaxID=1158996 RepID=UPI0015F6A51E|nr:hypothetical protein [Paraliobacillus salinarum]
MKIVKALKEFEFEQSVMGLSKNYIALCQHRLKGWKTYTIDELFIDDVTQIKPRHIKLFIRYRQSLEREKNITLKEYTRNVHEVLVDFQPSKDDKYGHALLHEVEMVAQRVNYF